MTPDKIYMLPEVASTVKVLDEEVEYIRKDALLEWAEEEMGNWSSESATGQCVKMGITLVLDKIESL